ncbi:protein BREAKING OF ASYMMETRY IN THE STOMATAL LINEAGE [Vitis riparia]|uniref:protein BREAKING OF ASYMMETRY IN THE STOMATAL LINEAGE n=1 Tax=Vitis riparia TaxID=96939 RepID=UPI00155AA85A|nr:protein BREAKING OF ASYMMETRY IN THE STOMATAL LINEAGE [Vitis riparia]
MDHHCHSHFSWFHFFKFKPHFPLNSPAFLSPLFPLLVYKRKRMCTPWTITSPVRWRIRDWTSMLCASRFSLEEEQGACSSLPQASTEAMFVETGCYNTNKCTRRTQVMRSPKQSLDSREDDSGGINGSRWPRFADEDYIVFCFGEDGTFDVIKDGKGGASDHINCMTRESRSSSRPVNRKLNYGEDEEGDYSYGCEDSYPSYEGDNIIYDKEGDEEESIYLDPGSPPDEIQGGEKIEEIEDCGTVSIESSSSNQSDDSAGSFAFPVLRWEGIGSPVQMPRSEDLQLRKHKARGLGFHCCRF